MIKFVLNLIYPITCGFCEKIGKEYICKKCEIEVNKRIVCKINRYKNKYYNKHLYIFKYNGIIRKKLIEYKFKDKIYLCKTFEKIIKKNKKICGFLESYDIIIPVPIHKFKKGIRGYNQSELIIKDLPNFNNKILYKVRNNKTQSKLNKIERIKNVQNVYAINNKEIILNKKILLFDDIFTTGNTVNECSRILLQAGAKEVGILTIAKD